MTFCKKGLFFIVRHKPSQDIFSNYHGIFPKISWIFIQNKYFRYKAFFQIQAF